MPIKRVVICSLMALVVPLVLSHEAGAQYRDRDRNRDRQVSPEDKGRESKRDNETKRKKRPRRKQSGVHDVQKEQRDKRAPRTRVKSTDASGDTRSGDKKRRRRARSDGRHDDVQPQEQRRRRARPSSSPRPRPRQERRRYRRRAERRWNRDGARSQGSIYIPRRWSYGYRPYHRHLWNRRYDRVWWCGVDCRIGLLFGFSVWPADTVLYHGSGYSFPIWEALEYNRNGETSLWESSRGYVEFTPTRTFTMRFGGRVRHCRDFLRVVVRNNGRERRYRGTACRNPHGTWWIVS